MLALEKGEITFECKQYERVEEETASGIYFNVSGNLSELLYLYEEQFRRSSQSQKASRNIILQGERCHNTCWFSEFKGVPDGIGITVKITTSKLVLQWNDVKDGTSFFEKI